MDLGPMGRGGARRRTRRRMTAMHAAAASAAPQQQTPTAPVPAWSDPASMLEMLKVLHAAGILNDEEYTAKKLQVVDLM